MEPTPTTAPDLRSFEEIGSPGTPGILLIARPFPLGNGYCIVENTLFTCPVNLDGSFEMEEGTDSINWAQVYDMGDESNEELRPIIKALGCDFGTIAANFCH